MSGELPAFASGTVQMSSTTGAMFRGAGNEPSASYTVSPMMAFTANNTAGNWPSNYILDDRYANTITLGAQQPMSSPVAVKSKLRICRVFLVDPDERLPTAKRFLYKSDELETDDTDVELWHSIPIKDLLDKHNAYRKSVKWEEKSGEGSKQRTGLKEIRIRDLVMSVTTIAEFAGR